MAEVALGPGKRAYRTREIGTILNVRKSRCSQWVDATLKSKSAWIVFSGKVVRER
jgi:hypothetical protein